MVDFDTHTGLLRKFGVKVVAASVDSVERTAALAEGLRLGGITVLADLDAAVVSEATGAMIQTGDRTFLHATGFVLDPSGAVVNSVYSSGPIGRLTASDVLRKIDFEQRK